MARDASVRRQEREIEVPSGALMLKGILGVPEGAKGVVAFAHGSGSGRFSPRNNFVARELQAGGFATLLMDLLSEAEAQSRRAVFDVDLLASRLLDATDWLKQQPATRDLPIGYFGASTGAAAALEAAARLGPVVGAVVSRGGRPDLAAGCLPQVTAPTLLIVGGLDEPVIALNEMALRLLRAPKQLVIVPGATHLFEEPGALEEVARLARDWFDRYLARRSRPEAKAS